MISLKSKAKYGTVFERCAGSMPQCEADANILDTRSISARAAPKEH
jgi:hypothetical protein